MARKKNPSKPPSKAYLISFGDTMTALLAFFIVLNSLAEEQTGANLHSGTGSFVRAFSSAGGIGTPGSKTTGRAFDLEESSPKYIIGSSDDSSDLAQKSTGPDDVDDQQRIIDRQEDDFQRFLQEAKRLHEVGQIADVTGEIAFDVLNRLPPKPPYMTEGLRRIILDAAPTLRRPGYSMRLTVWATMPSKAAWLRAVTEAAALRDEVNVLLREAGVSVPIEAVGQPWISSTVKRPSVSVIMQKLKMK